MRRYLPFIIVAVVGLITLASGTMLYRAKRVAVSPTSKIERGLEKRGDKSAHILGKADAPVTLEEFGDFECPPCGNLAEPINQLERDYRGRLCVIFRNFPLPNHQHAQEAALAAEAAGVQGRFWQMHDVLYREQALWSKAPDVRSLFKAYAGTIGVNVAQFEKDLDSEEVKKRVAADQQQGAVVGVTTTPTIFINDRTVPVTALNPTGLRAAVDAALKEKARAQ
jgi:protein-disulfide isomerase